MFLQEWNQVGVVGFERGGPDGSREFLDELAQFDDTLAPAGLVSLIELDQVGLEGAAGKGSLELPAGQLVLRVRQLWLR